MIPGIKEEHLAIVDAIVLAGEPQERSKSRTYLQKSSAAG